MAEAEVPTPESVHNHRSGWRGPALAALAVSALIAFAVGLVIRSSVPGNGLFWMIDFKVYYAGGAAVLDGSLLYDLKVGSYNLPFVYTPFASLFFVPFALLSAGVAETLWAVLNVLAVGAVAWLALGMIRVAHERFRLVTAVGVAISATVLGPVLENLYFGQINVLLILLVLIDFQPWMPARWRGIATGIAAGVKLIPLIFVVYLLCIGRCRAAAQAGAAFTGTFLVGLLFLPSPSIQYWFAGTALETNRMLTRTDVNHSLFGLFSRLSGDPTSPPGWALAVAVLGGLLGLVVATVANRRGHDLLGVLIVAFTAVLVSPVTWIPHYVWIVPALIWLASATWRDRTMLPTMSFALGVLWFTLPVYWYANAVGGVVPYQTTPTGNLLATLGSPLTPTLLTLATAPLWLPRLRPSEPGPLESPRSAG